MGTITIGSKKYDTGWVATILLTAALVVWLGYGSCSGDAGRIVASVPIGTSLADLDGRIENWGLDPGNVMQWIPTKDPPDREDTQLRVDGVRIKTDFGTFLQEDLGNFRSWSPTDDERSRFTGEITFFHHAHWNAEIIGFIFVDGKLVKADWGYLPG